MFAHEWALQSCKMIYKLQDITELEAKLWMDHVNCNGFTLTNQHEIFEPFDGEQVTYLNDARTNQLRIRTWIWTAPDTSQHTILDINAWPGDNESGVIAFDTCAIMDNGDQNLNWINDKVFDKYEFSEREHFFAALRISVDYDEEDDGDDDDIAIQIKLFKASEQGQAAKLIENKAWELYNTQFNAVLQQHTVLQNTYISEFKYLKCEPKRISRYGCLQFNIEDVMAFALQIDYQLKPNYAGRFDDHTQFRFVQWGDKMLVTIFENYEINTYLLTDSKIDTHVYTRKYLVTPYDFDNPILSLLAPRIHAYFKVLYDK